MQSERRPLLVVQGRPIRYSGQSFHLDIAPELGNLAARQSGGIRVIRYITLFGWLGRSLLPANVFRLANGRLAEKCSV